MGRVGWGVWLRAVGWGEGEGGGGGAGFEKSFWGCWDLGRVVDWWIVCCVLGIEGCCVDGGVDVGVIVRWKVHGRKATRVVGACGL